MFCMFKCVKCGYIPSNRGGSQYYCKKHNEDPESEGQFYAKYGKKSYYCGKHMKAYKNNYYFTHKKDLCDDCLNLHIDFKIRDYNLMEPNIKQLKENLNLMEKNINILRIKIENITRRLLEALKVFKRYHYITKDIIGKYELFNHDLKNYAILKSPRNYNPPVLK